ncbi:hypothetical protein B0H10DRAFT_2130148 [Mycena sp. CBHHK59/15]|nr:hypothetical protein B0H10DRAFT_2130148 [Mycena sp. CBHHK59/15]
MPLSSVPPSSPTSIYARHPLHRQIDADAADVVHQIIWRRRCPKHQQAGPKEIALTLQPPTERPPFANVYGRHRTVDKGIGQSMFEQVQSSRCRCRFHLYCRISASAVNVPGTTTRFQLLRKTTIAPARTCTAHPFSHASRRIWQKGKYTAKVPSGRLQVRSSAGSQRKRQLLPAARGMESSWMVQTEFPAGENMENQLEVKFLSQLWGGRRGKSK